MYTYVQPYSLYRLEFIFPPIFLRHLSALWLEKHVQYGTNSAEVEGKLGK